MVVNGVVTIVHMTLSFQLSKHLLEVDIVWIFSLYASWVNGFMCIRVPKVTIFDVGGLKSMSTNLFVLSFLYVTTKWNGVQTPSTCNVGLKVVDATIEKRSTWYDHWYREFHERERKSRIWISEKVVMVELTKSKH